MSISGLLIHIPFSNLTKANASSNISDLQPHFNQFYAMISGNPTTISSPVGNGMCFTEEDHVVYKFPVSDPWPCPFYIKECPTGFTLSFWFRWEYVLSTYYRMYATFGNTLKIYRGPNVKNNRIDLRLNADQKFSWYFGVRLEPGKWNLVMWMVNDTHSVGYLNGLKQLTRKMDLKNKPSDITNEVLINPNFNAGNFSMGQMQIWSGRKSPVFIWRLYQEGLLDIDDN